MSSSTSSTAPVLLGGFPRPIDLAPSIIFLVVHGLLFTRFVQQLIALRRQHGRFHAAIVRLVIFEIVRMVTFVIRAGEAKTAEPSIRHIIAGQVFLSIGLIILTFPCITLTRDLLLKTHPELAKEVDEKGKPIGILKSPRILQRMLFIPIILAIAGGSIATTDSSVSTILRHVGNYFLLSILAFHVFSFMRIERKYKLQRGPLVLLVLATIFALVVAIYKTIQIYSDSYFSTINTPVVFYCVFAVPEVLCALCFAIPDIAKVYSGIGEKVDAQIQMEANGQVVQMEAKGQVVIEVAPPPYANK